MTDRSIKSRGILYVFPAFDAEEQSKKIRYPAADNLFRVSLILTYHYKDGSQTLALQEIDAALSSDLTGERADGCGVSKNFARLNGK